MLPLYARDAGLAPRAPGAVRTDCRHYTGTKPCPPHKADARTCVACDAFEPLGIRILVVKTGALGDVLRCTAVLPGIRRAYPGAHVTWITAPEAKPLLDGNSLIDRVLTVDGPIAAVLLVESFDLVLGLDNDHASAALSALARAPERRGFTLDPHGRVLPANRAAEEWWTMGLDDGRKRANRRTHVELMYEVCELDAPCGAPQLTLSPDSVQAARDALGAVGCAPPAFPVGVCIASGGRWVQKRWTAGGTAAFLDALRTRVPDAVPVLLSGPRDLQFNAEVLRLVSAPVPHIDCSRSIGAFAALLSLMRAVVTTDSLPLHVAVALGTPVVAVVGPTSPWEIAGAGVEVVSTARECVGCYLERCPHAVTCMDELSPAAVLTGLERVLAGCASRR